MLLVLRKYFPSQGIRHLDGANHVSASVALASPPDGLKTTKQQRTTVHHPIPMPLWAMNQTIFHVGSWPHHRVWIYVSRW